MKFNYEGHSLKSGIYKIINNFNGRIYIGSASMFKRRWQRHVSDLKSNKHGNHFLQNDFNKCEKELGHNDFLEFHIVELTDASNEERKNREQHWITSLYDNQCNCYNLSKTARVLASSVAKSMGQSEIYKEKAKIRSKAIWSDESRRLRQSETLKAFWQNPDNKLKASKKMESKIYTLQSPTGMLVTFTNMNEFCRKQNFVRSSLRDVVCGKKLSYKGWTKPI